MALSDYLGILMRLIYAAVIFMVSSPALAVEKPVLRMACLETGGTRVACACGQILADQMLDFDVQEILAVYIREKKPPLQELKRSNVSVSDLITAAEKWSVAVEATCQKS